MNPSGVDNFRLYFGTSSGSYSGPLDVGKPATDSTGAFYYDYVVADSTTIYAAVSAMQSGLESPRSNEVVRAGIPVGTQPPPPPPPSSGSSAVNGFVLWNALANTSADNSFVNGDIIPDSLRSCAAIEAVGNSYLAQMNTAGSVAISIDGGSARCENNPPFASGSDENADIGCDIRLAAIGNHTLTATPYDSDGCTGVSPGPTTVTFTVSGTPAPSTLGAPGQPYIVQ